MQEAIEIEKGWTICKRPGDPRTSYEVIDVLPDGQLKIRSLETGSVITETLEKMEANGYKAMPPAEAGAAPLAQHAPKAEQASLLESPGTHVDSTPQVAQVSAGHEVEHPPSSDAPARDPIGAIEAQWQADRARLDERYRAKIIDAHRKTKPLARRRDEALTLLDRLRDFARGEDLELDDDRIDAAIEALVRESIDSGRIRKMIDSVRGVSGEG